jgi:hypothetical protein
MGQMEVKGAASKWNVWIVPLSIDHDSLQSSGSLSTVWRSYQPSLHVKRSNDVVVWQAHVCDKYIDTCPSPAPFNPTVFEDFVSYQLAG